MKKLQAWRRSFIVLGNVFLIIAGLYFGQALLTRLALAIVFSFILSPLVIRLERRGLARVWASSTVVFGAVLFVVLLGGVFVLQMRSLILQLPDYQKNTVEKFEKAKAAFDASWLGELQHNISERKAQKDAAVFQADMPASKTPPPKDPKGIEFLGVDLSQFNYFALIGTTLAATLDFLVDFGIVILLVLFMLMNWEDLRNRLLRLSGSRSLASMTRALDDASHRISRYLMMQLAVNIIYGTLVGIGLFFLGLPYALLWGFVGAILRYIPYLGPWIAAVLPTVLAVAVFESWTPVFAVAALFIVLELITNNVLEIWLYGQSIGVSNLVILVAALFWTWIWGPIGLLLSTPLTACLVVLGRNIPSMQFLDILLGEGTVLPPHFAYTQRLLARDDDEATEIVEKYLENHSPEEAFHRLLLPAVHFARQSESRGEMTHADMRFFYRATRQSIETALSPFHPVAPPAPGENGEASAGPILIFGLPARDESDELGLRMARALLDPSRFHMEILSFLTPRARVFARIRKSKPKVLCIFDMPPGGQLQARRWCSQIHREFPDLKIVIVSWNAESPHQRAQDIFERAGADAFVVDLKEMREHFESDKEGARPANSSGTPVAHSPS